MYDATGQTAADGLEGRCPKDIVGLRLPSDNYHLRVRVSASILLEKGEGGVWTYDSMDSRGRTMWRASQGKGRCNVDPASKTIVRG